MRRSLILAVLLCLGVLAPASASAAPNVPPTITVQPEMGLVPGAGYSTQFTAQADGTPAPSVRWQVAPDRNGPWTDVTGNNSETSTTLAVTATSDTLGDAYRAVFTNASGTAVSRPAKLVSRMNWMGDLGSDIADVPLNELTIPGAHDMGTYGFSADDSVSGVSLDDQVSQLDCLSHSVCVSYGRAQDPSNTGVEMLTYGIRYFDLRVCGHDSSGELDLPTNWSDFTNDPVTCHGLEAAHLATILADTRAFVLAHPSEVVILDVNHEFQVDEYKLAQQIVDAFALPGGKSLLISPTYCGGSINVAIIDSGECASHLTLRKIWQGHLGNVIVNFENDGAPGSTHTTPASLDNPGGPEQFPIQPTLDYSFYDAFPQFWGRLNDVPVSSEFCTTSSATTSCFGNNSDRYYVLAAVLSTLGTRSSFSDPDHFLVQFLQSTPDGGYIAGNPDGSLFDMATHNDIGTNPIIGPWLFDCGFGVNTCFAAQRPENINILAINFFDRTDYGVNPMSAAEIAGCVDNQGPCDIPDALRPTINFNAPICKDQPDPAAKPPRQRLCTYSSPVTFDFIDQVVRFNEYARTPPVVSVTPAAAPAASGWYNAATLGGAGKTLLIGVFAHDYYYSLGLDALGCQDGGAPLAISPDTPTTSDNALGLASLGDGVHQIACQATDAADKGFDGQGNQGAGPGSSASPTIQIDTHPPTVTFSGDAGSYGILANVAINCTAADTLSGVASSTCANTSAPAWSLGAGSHTLSASATDKAGNTASASATFNVTVTGADLDTLTHQLVDGSARYRSLPLFMKAIVDIQVGVTDLTVRGIGSKTTAAQKRTLEAAYGASVKALASSGWLTSAQANTLIGLAAAL